MPIQSAQSVLNLYYAVRTDLLTGKIASYSIGDKNITLQDMSELERIIQYYESAVVCAENGIIVAGMGGASDVPAPGSPATGWLLDQNT
jgi:hypothetical protein